MQRYDITIPLIGGQFTPSDIALVANGLDMTIEGDFRTAAYMASMGGVVSYLPHHRMYGFSFFICEGAKRGSLYVLYPDISEPQVAIIRPWHQFRSGTVMSRITMADAAYMLTKSTMRSENLDRSNLSDLLLEMVKTAGFDPYIIQVIDQREEQPSDGEPEEDEDEAAKAPILVRFMDKTMLWLTMDGPLLPIGLSRRGFIAQTMPEAAAKRGSIFLSCWIAPSAEHLPLC